MRCLILVVLAVALSACGNTRGTDFARPGPDNLVLGTTTQDEALKRYGKPSRQTVRTVPEGTSLQVGPENAKLTTAPVGGTFASIGYTFADMTATILIGMPPSFKGLELIFWNSRLVAYDFVSNFSDDTTNFDETKVTQIAKGTSTGKDVVRLFGAPTGEWTYPLVAQPGGRQIVYRYAVARRGAKPDQKRLAVVLDANDRVRDLRFTGGGAALTQQ